MTEFISKVERCGGSIEVLIASGEVTRVVELRCVLDHDDFNEVSGIEILDFDSQLAGASMGPSPVFGYPRWSYDPEVDAAYFHVSNARGQHQLSSTATALISNTGQLLSISVACAF